MDVAHLNVIYPAGIFALELKKKYGIPFILTEHWTAFLSISPTNFSALEKHFIKKIGKEVSVFCPVSNDLKKAFEKIGFQGPYSIVPNVVDTNLFSLSEKKIAAPIKILNVSTFKDDHKNISGILRVIAKLQSRAAKFEVTMVGNKFGDQYDGLIQTLGIPNDCLSILPVVPSERIAELMRTHHIFLLFSNYENLPCVIAEAHCTGMVAIGSDVGGTGEMIDNTNGVLVQARDEESLLEKLNLVMDNLETYSPKEIRSKAVQRYSYESVSEAFIKIYEEVLA